MWKQSPTRINVMFQYDPALVQKFKQEVDGRTWNGEGKYWTFPSPQIVSAVRVFGGPKHITAEQDVKDIYNEELKRKQNLNDIRKQEDSHSIKDILDSKLKLPLYNYQNVAVEFANVANGRIVIADQQGIGKTATAIGYIEYNDLTALVICPKSVVIGWVREIQRFTGVTATVWSVKGPSGPLNARYHVVNYDIVDRFVDNFNKLKADVLVCDEATFIKNKKTRRTKSIFGDGRKKQQYPGIKTKHCLFLTGTPVMNKPTEVFTLLNFLDPLRFNNFYHFITKYGGWRGEPPKNLSDLHERTKNLIIRRLRSDVLPELPPKQRNDLYVELSSSEMREYTNLLNGVFRKWKTSGRPSVAEMPPIQQFLISKKIPRLIELIDEILEQGRSVLVYCTYIDPLIQLNKHYGDLSEMVIGKYTGARRQESIDRLSSGKAKVGLFSIGAGSMGIDGLQNSIDTVVFLDRYWIPSMHEQAEDRITRIGQKSSVSCYYMTCVDTIDEYMRILLKEKQEIIDTIIDGKVINPAATRSMFREFVGLLKKNYVSKLNKLSLDTIIEDDIGETVVEMG